MERQYSLTICKIGHTSKYISDDIDRCIDKHLKCFGVVTDNTAANKVCNK